MATSTRPNELKIIRTYNTPLKKVWEAWTDQEQLAQWWGPRGFSITTHSKELKVGGVWDYTMHGPDGKDWPNLTKYYEVETAARLVYDHGGSRTTPPMFRVTVLFSENNGQTTQDMTMAFPTPEAARDTEKFIAQVGGNTTWDRLGEFLEKRQSGNDVFIINRSFKAPRSWIYKMWTDPAEFSKWLAPTGFRMEFKRADIRSGGSTFYLMTNDSGVDMYGRAQYQEILNPQKLVYTQQFCDKDEKVSRNPFAPTWPETMATAVTFTEEGPQETRVTVQWSVHGKCSKDELNTFISARAGMSQGWTGSFDKLDAMVAKL